MPDPLTQQQRILILEDSSTTRSILRRALEQVGYLVWHAATAEAALELVEHHGLPHLALVDINLGPNMNGFEFSEAVHRYSDLPIIFISATSDEETVVTGLDLHAEDFIVKPQDGPIRTAELCSRIRRVLRRIGDYSYGLERITYIDERLQINFVAQIAHVEGEEVNLTPTEAKILHLLLRHAGRTLTNEYLLRRLYPLEEAYEERLHSHVYRLRRKIEIDNRNPRYVVGDWGKGYFFPAPPDEIRIAEHRNRERKKEMLP